jgi:hypothetical protein
MQKRDGSAGHPAGGTRNTHNCPHGTGIDAKQYGQQKQGRYDYNNGVFFHWQPSPLCSKNSITQTQASRLPFGAKSNKMSVLRFFIRSLL